MLGTPASVSTNSMSSPGMACAGSAAAGMTNSLLFPGCVNDSFTYRLSVFSVCVMTPVRIIVTEEMRSDGRTFTLGGHPKPAINGHLKTGHFE
jgi:hypothetical protein